MIDEKEFPPHCYYCPEQFGSIVGYKQHVCQKHTYLPGFPGPADLEKHKLQKQGMSWERQLPPDNIDKYLSRPPKKRRHSNYIGMPTLGKIE